MRALFCLIVLIFALTVSAQAPCDTHGCTYASAIEGNTTITFGDYYYAPKCIRVALGTVVTFVGDFGGHPLVSGYYVLPNATPFNGSITNTKTGSEVSFTMNVAGSNPYYCEYHKERGMVGVIYVGDSCGTATPSGSAPTTSTPTGTTPVGSNVPVGNPVAPTSTKTPAKASSAVAIQIGALSLLAVLAF